MDKIWSDLFFLVLEDNFAVMIECIQLVEQFFQIFFEPF